MPELRHEITPPIRRQRPGPLRILIAGLLCLVAIAAGTYSISTNLTEQTYPKDMRGHPVILPPIPLAVREASHAVAALPGMSLRVPSAGLAVPLGELNEVNGVIDPPGFTSAYIVRNFGVSLAHIQQGTLFVVMHSCRGGATCPGNYLINVAAGTASVKTGANVYINNLHYRVTGWTKVYKPNVHTAPAIWANTPGRLVLFTCLQTPTQTESIDNIIISAQLVSPGR